MEWRNGVIEQRMLPVAELMANPANWRRHPPVQRAALDLMLARVGFAGAVLWNRRLGQLIDGHLRVEAAKAAGEAQLPAVIVDMDADEERLLLAAYDPLGAMAGILETGIAGQHVIEHALGGKWKGRHASSIIRSLTGSSAVVPMSTIRPRRLTVARSSSA